MSKVNLSAGIIKRHNEVNNVVNLWRKMYQGDANATFCEHYGIPGIGKTELVKQIEKALQDEGALCAHLDFDPVQNPWGDKPLNERVKQYYEKPEELFRDVLTAWRYFDSSEFKRYITKSMKQQHPLKPMFLASEVVQKVCTLTSQRSVVLICDEADKIDWVQLSWFLEEFICPLALSKRCLVVWIDRKQKKWEKLFERASEIVASSNLKPFDVDDVIEQLKMSNLQLDDHQITELGYMIWEITGGHPMAAEAAVRYLQNNLTNDITDVAQITHEVIKIIAEKVIKNYILQDNPLDLEAVCILSLMRVDDEPLYRVLASNSSTGLPPYGKLKIMLMSNPLAGEFGVQYLKNPLTDWLNQYFGVIDQKNYLLKQGLLLQECKRLSQNYAVTKMSKWLFYTVEQIYHAACANRIEYRYDLVRMLTESKHLFLTSGKEDYFETAMNQLEGRLRGDKYLRKLVGDAMLDQLADVPSS